MHHIIQTLPELRDNRVLRCAVDFEARTLTLDTIAGDGRKTVVCFSRLLAHKFENVECVNILFGIDEVTLGCFFDRCRALLEDTLPYGFPICGTQAELRRHMAEQGIRMFELSATLGLCGFVLAAGVDVRVYDEVNISF